MIDVDNVTNFDYLIRRVVTSDHGKKKCKVLAKGVSVTELVEFLWAISILFELHYWNNLWNLIFLDQFIINLTLESIVLVLNLSNLEICSFHTLWVLQTVATINTKRPDQGMSNGGLTDDFLGFKFEISIISIRLSYFTRISRHGGIVPSQKYTTSCAQVSCVRINSTVKYLKFIEISSLLPYQYIVDRPFNLRTKSTRVGIDRIKLLKYESGIKFHPSYSAPNKLSGLIGYVVR